MLTTWPDMMNGGTINRFSVQSFSGADPNDQRYLYQNYNSPPGSNTGQNSYYLLHGDLYAHPALTGNAFALAKWCSGVNIECGALLTQDILYIDQKIDNGLPLSGNIRGHDALEYNGSGSVIPCSQNDGSGTFKYVVSESRVICRLHYLVDTY